MVATAVYCGRRSDSAPKLTGFFDALSFEVSLSLAGSGFTCSEWKAVDYQQKIMDMENGLRGAESSCSFRQIPCFKNSMWTCSSDGSSDISFR